MQTIHINNLQQAPLTLIMSGVMVLVSLLFIFQQLTTIPCGKDLLSAFSRNFIHVDPLHLIINLYGFYRLTELEASLGSIRYLGLILVLAFFQTILEWLYLRTNLSHNPFSILAEANCSIGFSGILFGIISWMFFSQRGVDIKLLLLLITSITMTAAQDPRISFIGHLIGLIAGLIALPITRWLGLIIPS